MTDRLSVVIKQVADHDKRISDLEKSSALHKEDYKEFKKSQEAKFEEVNANVMEIDAKLELYEDLEKRVKKLEEEI